MASEWLRGLQERASGVTVPRPAAEPREAVTKPRRQLPPFTGRDPARDYRAMYRAACDLHERHNPPRITADYWEAATDDLTATAQRFNDDPFLIALLAAVFEELEREYKAIQTGDQQAN